MLYFGPPEDSSYVAYQEIARLYLNEDDISFFHVDAEHTSGKLLEEVGLRPETIDGKEKIRILVGERSSTYKFDEGEDELDFLRF